MRNLNWMIKACGIFLLWGATSAALPAQSFTTLHSFSGTDGSLPQAGLVQGANGDLYGSTEGGGTVDFGTIFKITTSGTLTPLHSFDGTDGEAPIAALIQATNGDFYGTAPGGGNFSSCSFGCGTIFKITSSGTLTVLHIFDSTDGADPQAGLVQASNGDLYGTTDSGGANGNNGTVFKVTTSGVLTTLHSFDGTDGDTPAGTLIQATNGNFYGTTVLGGAHGYGTVFEITPSGTLTTLYSFCAQTDCSDGEQPEAGLVQATNGNFYGTTESGGGANGSGTVFTVTPSGALTTLYSFCSQNFCTDGAGPAAGLVQATDGNFYGTTVGGGANGYGEIFQVTESGALTVVHSFDFSDGETPYAPLVQDTNGKLYGTAAEGGADDDGTVFSLSMGLGPFVETNPAAGKVGAKIGILGTDLTGATSVSFNGKTASFTVKSKTLIVATVPSGATTGEVKVQLPKGTLSSNVPFIVLP